MAATTQLKDAILHCPHCGHNVHLDIDISEEEQDYQDECAACGGDIHIRIHRDIGDGKLHVSVDADDEQYY
ncbi:CPXCG motif-containing cysteine-rich protein [Aliidiomarina sedimenti]|uniref:CPXCG motif-containing cysteine-rich protein n=1 Tax=Aliidiomarina sedimenti TaxID=1933879 RepID=A0ABY0C265_9GAMM|nr:CPXCG motif-containing cysteine-rich protein [Aliidiomarina sedimenti]RUO31667.1 CPXCG motif-containing cysteine-rich protein [Aliidiomarina sedimenti]